MRVLLLFCHPVEDSYQAALHRAARAALEQAGHHVDDSTSTPKASSGALARRADRLPRPGAQSGTGPGLCRAAARSRGAGALLPGLEVRAAGDAERLFRPGVPAGRRLYLGADGKLTPTLRHIRKLGAITTYGRERWVAWLMGDPPRKLVTACCAFRSGPAPGPYLAHYHMNASTEATRARFLARSSGRWRSSSPRSARRGAGSWDRPTRRRHRSWSRAAAPGPPPRPDRPWPQPRAQRPRVDQVHPQAGAPGLGGLRGTGLERRLLGAIGAQKGLPRAPARR